MANQVPILTGTPIVFADASFSGTVSGFTQTVQLNLNGIAIGASRESVKADLLAKRAARFLVRAGIEFAVAPDAGDAVRFYWSNSISVTAGTGNDGGCSGTDGDYKAGEEEEWQAQLIPLGSMSVTNDAATVVQIQTVGTLWYPQRFGQVVVYNAANQAFEADAIEMFVALIPIIDEIQ